MRYLLFFLVLVLTNLDMFLTNISLSKGNIEMSPLLANLLTKLSFSEIWMAEVMAVGSISLLCLLNYGKKGKIGLLSKFVLVLFAVTRAFAVLWNLWVIFI